MTRFSKRLIEVCFGGRVRGDAIKKSKWKINNGTRYAVPVEIR